MIKCDKKNIGKNVKVDESAEIICEELYLGDGVIIGKNSKIEGKIVKIGDYTVIGDNFTGIGIDYFEVGKKCRLWRNSSIKSRYIKIGDNTRFLGVVTAGGGGWKDPQSKFIIGNNCQIGDECFINTARPFIMKDKAAVAPRCTILTHGFWQSILEGYSVVYKPVILEENSWVTINCVVLPGVTIGKNSVVAAGSVVTKDVPPNCLAGGVPAKVIKENYPKEPTQEEKEKIILKIIEDYRPFLEVLGYKVAGSEGLVEFEAKEKEYVICFDKFFDFKKFDGKRIILIGFNPPEEVENSTIFNLKKLTVSGVYDKESERFRNHLRRHGIVFDFDGYNANPYAAKYWCIYE